MKKFLVSVLLLIALNLSFAFETIDRTYDTIIESAEQSIKGVFGENINLDFVKYSIPEKIKNNIQSIAKQAFFRNEVYVWKISKSDSLIGYAILDNVKGKAMPITFIVIFDLDANIISAEIIKYREQIGGEVQNERWEKQFTGKNSNSNFIVGVDVYGISGATISVTSVSKGIQKLTYLIDEIRSEL